MRAGASINHLPMLAIEPDLETFYRDNVIGGPGAFVIAAASLASFAGAIPKEHIIEISDSGGTRPIANSSPSNPTRDEEC